MPIPRWLLVPLTLLAVVLVVAIAVVMAGAAIAAAAANTLAAQILFWVGMSLVMILTVDLLLMIVAMALQLLSQSRDE